MEDRGREGKVEMRRAKWGKGEGRRKNEKRGMGERGRGETREID